MILQLVLIFIYFKLIYSLNKTRDGIKLKYWTKHRKHLQPVWPGG